MKRAFGLSLIASALVVLACPAPALAQGNDDDYTPLNSRIRRDRQYPTEPRTRIDRSQISQAGRERSRNMSDQFARCLWDRSNEDGRDLLVRTDFGFVNFAQIGLNGNSIRDYYPIQTCLSRVASTHNSSVNLSYTAEAMRRWYLQAAYLGTWAEGPTWAVPGQVAGTRAYPLSANNSAVRTALEFADCVVSQDPHAADYFFRTAADSEGERAATQQLMPALGPCLPNGQQIELSPFALRVWLGEALWHAANTSAAPPPAPAATATSQEAQ